MENVGFEPCTVHGTLHGPGCSGSGGIGAGSTLPGGQAFADAFHTFAVDWSPNAVTWSVDGTVHQRRTPADLGGRQWVFDKPFFLILNLAVGGHWPGDPDGSTAFPQQLLVDHVRVTGGGTRPGGGPITGVGGKCVDVAGANGADGTPAVGPPRLPGHRQPPRGQVPRRHRRRLRQRHPAPDPDLHRRGPPEVDGDPLTPAPPAPRPRSGTPPGPGTAPARRVRAGRR